MPGAASEGVKNAQVTALRPSSVVDCPPRFGSPMLQEEARLPPVRAILAPAAIANWLNERQT